MLSETWRNSGFASRSGLISGAVLILVLTLAALWWLLQTRNGVLFTDLQAADAAAVVAELERLKVDYKLAAEGTRILVDQDQVHEIRLKLLGGGLPLSGGVGFELFDKAEFGMTEFAQRINFQRALQGELTRTITSLKEVKYARVHLVMQEASLFQQDKSPPSASITLFLKAGAELDKRQIEGVQRLVSAAVPGLERDGVTILDQYGKSLTPGLEEEGVTTAVTNRLQKKREVETYLTEKVVQVLERTFGPGKAIVSIDVSLNFDQSQTTREEVIPGSEKRGSVVRRRETHAQQGGGKREQTAPAEINSEIEYRLGRSVAQVVTTPGKIDRLSVGVLIPVGSSNLVVNQVEQLVSMAIGLDIQRGDAIAVYAATTEILPELHPENSFTTPSDRSMATSGERMAPFPTADQATETPHSDWSQYRSGDFSAWASRAWEQHQSTIAVGIVMLFGLVLWRAIDARSTSGRRLEERRLEASERERVLAQLKTWINTEERSVPGEGEAT